MNVYRDFDQAELDRQYNVRASIPDYLEIFRRWQAESARFRQTAGGQAFLGLCYGADPAQAIDLFRTGRSGAPLVGYIHGGYWHSLDKSDFSSLGEAYVADGINFAAINYRLAPAVSMDDIVADVRSAMVWLEANAPEYDYDPAQIYVTGNSAGGHLTAMMVSTRWEEFGGRPDLVKGGCAVSGLYDLEPIRLCYLNGSVRLDAAAAARNSPAANIPAHAPPLILAVGGGESAEFHRQQDEFKAAWEAKGLCCSVVAQVNGHHFDMCERVGQQDSPLYRAIVALARSRSAPHPTS